MAENRGRLDDLLPTNVTTFEAALLGVIQGLTEFLPISSSAHLILARSVFGWDAGEFSLAFDVACHVGTLIAVVVFFRRDIVIMVKSVPQFLQGVSDENSRMVKNIVLATLPIAFAGVFFGDFITTHFRTVGVAAAALAVGAVLMVMAERLKPVDRTEASLTFFEVLALGLAQALALIPGISRSGAVITLAMLLGIRRDSAARLAFLISIPAILGAAGRQGIELVGTNVPTELFGLCAIGIIASASVGYVTVKYFIRYLENHSLDGFAAYRFGLAGCIFFLLID